MLLVGTWGQGWGELRDWFPMALAFRVWVSLHRVARFLISGNTCFALPFFT